MTKDERIEMLREAQNAVRQAMEDIREATDNDSYTEAYLGAPLSIMVSEGKYVSQNLTIEAIIDGLDEMDLKDDSEDDSRDFAHLAGLTDQEEYRWHRERTTKQREEDR